MLLIRNNATLLIIELCVYIWMYISVFAKYFLFIDVMLKKEVLGLFE